MLLAASGWGQVVINEIMYHPASEDVREEFIELLNTGPATVYLAGWQFSSGVRFVFPSISLNPGSYLVVAADLATFTAMHPGVGNVVGDWEGILSNRGETLELVNSLGDRIDRVRYADEGDWADRRRGEPDFGHQGWTWDTPHDGGGASVELRNPALPHTAGQNWAPSPIMGGTPGAVNGAASANIPPIVLDVQHIPPLPRSLDPVTVLATVEDEAATGIELSLHYRPDGDPAFLMVPMVDDGLHNDGVELDGTYGATIGPHPDDTVVEFFLQAKDGTGLTRTWPAPVGPPARLLGRWSLDDLTGEEAADSSGGGHPGILTNGAAFTAPGRFGNGAIRLSDTNDYLLLEQDVSPPPLGAATFTLATWFRRDAPGTLTHTGGTGVDAEPLIAKGRSESDGDVTDMNYFLGLLPVGAGDDVVLAADFEEHSTSGDPGRNRPIEGTTAIATGVWHHAAATYDGTTWRLYLDGSLEATLNVGGTPNYASIQPAAVGIALDSEQVPDGSFLGLIDEVVITDGALSSNQIASLVSANAYQPEPGEQLANVLYQVDDTQDPPGVETHRILMTEAERLELEELGNDRTEARTHAQMNGTFLHWDGHRHDVRYLVGIRNRGEGSRTANPNNRRVNFRSDDAWQGTLAINFNSRYTWLQTAGSALFHRAGLAAAIAFPAQLRVNNDDLARSDNRMYGAYARVEVVNSDFADQHYPVDSAGNIYQGRRNWQNSSLSADLEYLGDDPTPYRLRYFKNSNSSEDDWSDLIDLCAAISVDTPDAIYEQEVERTVNVPKWMRALALHVLLDNRETNISNGDGDDYIMYRGVDDPRFELIPHDLDTILDQGDTGGSPSNEILEFTDLPVLDRMMDHPAFAPVYYGQLLDLMQGILSAESAETLLRQVLAGHAPETSVDEILQFLSDRLAYVDSIVPQALTADAPTLSPQGGVLRTTALTADLEGEAHAARTRAIRVNGATVDWNPRQATWQIGGVSLVPGVNSLRIEALDEAEAVFETTTLDVWSDGAAGTPVSGTLATGGTWTATGGPYLLSGTVQVPAGQTLTLEPGTTLFAEAGATLLVNGTLIAEGTAYQPLHLTTPPGSGTTWEGLRFIDSEGTNRLAYVDIDNADTGSQSILVRRSTLHLDHVTWSGTQKTLLELDDASVDVRHCTFPSIDNNEAIHGSGMPDDGYIIIASSTFGTTTGYSDVIDFTGGQRPGPILQVLDNLFLGGSDDALDLDGTDAHIEGNVFMHFHKDNTSDSSSNAIATGSGGGTNSEITVVRNLFIDNDHAVLLKEGCHLVSQHNAYIGGTLSAINFDEPNRNVDPGRGADLESDLFWGNLMVFENQYVNDPVNGTTELYANRCMLPTAHLGLGIGNDDADPRLVDSPDDLHLGPGSPARGTGALGLDRGAYVPAGAAIGGIPTSPTRSTSATLAVGGPGITHYRYRLDHGAMSTERPVTEPIVLTGLTNGTYTVRAIGKNSAGVWQPVSEETVSMAWTVDTGYAILRINEVLADQASAVSVGGAHPDLVELYNDGPVAISLAGMGLSDRAEDPYRYTLPPGTSLDAGQYLVVAATTNAAGMLATGFGLSRNGEDLYLTAPPSAGGGILDSVSFGIQLGDHSIARDRNGDWQLAVPSFGGANTPIPVGDSTQLRINEWLANQESLYPDDFVELFNADALPVALGGLFLTDNPAGWPDQHPIHPLSFIGARGYTVFTADGNADAGADHLSFRLAADGGWIGLYDADGSEIDVLFYGSQAPDQSEGRTPSGGADRDALPLPTPGGPNPPGGLLEVVSEELMSITHAWRYHQSGTDLETAWRETGYDDRDWPMGEALLYVETSSLPAPKSTPLTLGPRTFYFRSTFTFTGDPTESSLLLTTVIDDGAIFHLNGQELYRLGMDSGTATYDTLAGRTVSNAGYEGPFPVPTDALVSGTNVLAVEVHQTSTGSSDIVFGLRLESQTTNRLGRIKINEVLGLNLTYPQPGTNLPDWVELTSTSESDVDLVNMSLTDDLALPRKWVFPAGTLIPGGGYAMIRCDSMSAASATNTGFGFDWEGDGVYLFDAPSRGGALVDGVTFGLQVPDMSLGRVPDGNGGWGLTEFTPAAANRVASLGDPTVLSVNEWMADPASGEDWFELYNPGPLPVPLHGLYLTDDLQDRTLSGIPPLSFLGAGPHGFKKFVADDHPELGSHHTQFKLSRNGEAIGIFNADLLQIHSVRFPAQQDDVSEGRWPDGGSRVYPFPGTATPQAPNAMSDFDHDGVGDLWEAEFGDASSDPDGDGLDNYGEFHAGTDALDPASYLGFVVVAREGLTLRAAYNAIAGKAYMLQASDDPGTGEWIDVDPVPPHPRDAAVELFLPLPSPAADAFYRLSLPE